MAIEAGQIREHMDVVDSTGRHVGTVDHLDGSRIKLTKSDPASGGTHHYVELGGVASVQGNEVKLSPGTSPTAS